MVKHKKTLYRNVLTLKAQEWKMRATEWDKGRDELRMLAHGVM